MSESKGTGKLVAMCVLCAICGFGGGVVANLTGIGVRDNQTARISDITDNTQDEFSSNPFAYNEEESSPFEAGAVLGMTVQQVTATDEIEGGVYVVSVSDESNAKDIILEGDRIVKVDNLEVTGIQSLSSYISSKEVGDTVNVVIKRDDEEMEVPVVLISRTQVHTDDNQKA